MKRIVIIAACLLLGYAVNAQQQGLVYTATPLQLTKGSRFFFDRFVRGFIIDTKGVLIKKPGYFFNYDKMSGGLLLRTGKEPVMLAQKSDIQSFTLYDDSQNAVVFERVPAIDTGRYVQVLVLGLKYKVYKLISTNYVHANYRTDGVYTEGNKYDEYVDDSKYYVLNLATNQLQKVSLKLNAFKTAFSAEGDKLDKFIALHPHDTINDVYLASLGEFINN